MNFEIKKTNRPLANWPRQPHVPSPKPMTYGPIPSLLSSMTCRGHLLSSPNHSKERIAFHRPPPPCIFLSPSSLSPLSLLPHQNQLPARIQPCRAAAPRAALQAQQRRPPAPRRPPARAPEARRDDARADPRRATEAAAIEAVPDPMFRPRPKPNRPSSMHRASVQFLAVNGVSTPPFLLLPLFFSLKPKPLSSVMELNVDRSFYLCSLSLFL